MQIMIDHKLREKVPAFPLGGDGWQCVFCSYANTSIAFVVSHAEKAHLSNAPVLPEARKHLMRPDNEVSHWGDVYSALERLQAAEAAVGDAQQYLWGLVAGHPPYDRVTASMAKAAAHRVLGEAVMKGWCPPARTIGEDT